MSNRHGFSLAELIVGLVVASLVSASIIQLMVVQSRFMTTQEYKWTVVSSGKPSVTHYDTVEAFRAATLLDIGLETGRTHQIRVHMAAIRHPCVGDSLYGADPMLTEHVGLDRQWLHAVQLGFEHPVLGEWVEIDSDYPEDLRHALDVVRAET